MITNAVQDVLTLNPRGLGYKNQSFYAPISETEVSSNTFQSHYLPICPNLIGGILLYQNELEEDPTKYYAPINNPLIGYASNDVNTTTDSKRGSMNQTESKYLDNGYKFVFDFSTSQGNGTISSIGLTSKWGGRYGYGHPLDKYKQHILKLSSQMTSATGTFASDRNLLRQANIVSFDPETENGIYVFVNSANNLEIGRVIIPVRAISLSEDFFGKCKNLDKNIHTITTTQFASVLTNNYFYGTFIDGHDGYIWGFQHLDNTQGNSSGNATILWIKINKEDFTFEEGSWTINAQLYQFGYYRAATANINSPEGYNYLIIKNGILYAIKYTSDNYMSGVYAISLNDPNDIQLLTFTDNSTRLFKPASSSNYYYYNFSTVVNEINGVIVYRGGYIHNGKLYPQYNNSSLGETYLAAEGLAACPKPGLQCGPFLLGITSNSYSHSSSTYYWSFWIYLMTTYLATINNLENPITKTEDKTMKITYILTEVEDEEETV